MEIYALVKNGVDIGTSSIILNKQESQLLIEVFEDFCKNNPRKKIAKKLLKQMNNNLQCY